MNCFNQWDGLSGFNVPSSIEYSLSKRDFNNSNTSWLYSANSSQ